MANDPNTITVTIADPETVEKLKEWLDKWREVLPRAARQEFFNIFLERRPQ